MYNTTYAVNVSNFTPAQRTSAISCEIPGSSVVRLMYAASALFFTGNFIAINLKE
jgi:hypothetical protein